MRCSFSELKRRFSKGFHGLQKINRQIAFSIPTTFLRSGCRCCRGDTVRPVDLPDYFRDCLFKINHIQENIGKNRKMVYAFVLGKRKTGICQKTRQSFTVF